MSPPGESTLPTTRRARKSIGTISSTRKTMETENATVDLGSSIAPSRRSRSKSMGPGGLDALKSGDGNRRASLAGPLKLPRSILKPTIPEIPPMKKTANGGPGSTRGRDLSNSSSSSGEDSKVAVRTEEEQQAAAKEKEERDRRDARRKSLANRRVSFAAEATLHTFHEIECAPDSTTSTDSTRRASSMSQTPQTPGSSTSDPQQGSPEKVDSNSQSPLDQQNQAKGPEPRAQNGDDDTMTSIIYSSDSEAADAVEEIAEEEVEGFSSDSDDGSMVTVDTIEITGTTVASNRSAASAEDSTLEEALRMAARRAGNQNLGSVSDDEALDDGEEVIPSFGWIKKSNQPQKSNPGGSEEQPRVESADDKTATDIDMDVDMDMDMDMDMDVTKAVGRILQPTQTNEAQTEEMPMEVTTALGGILPHDAASRNGAGSGPLSDVVMEDATMEFTTALGGIRPSQDTEDLDENENMSMELTTVLGGAINKNKRESLLPNRRRTLSQQVQKESDDATMDVTVAVGRIVAANKSPKEADEGMSMVMDVTSAIGSIIKNEQDSPRTLNKRVMMEEVDEPDGAHGAILTVVAKDEPSRSPLPVTQRALETLADSPGLSAFHGRGLRRSTGPSAQALPTREQRVSKTPSPAKPATPSKTRAGSDRVNSATRTQSFSSSPKRRTPRSEKTTPQPKRSSNKASPFHAISKLGSRTPTIVLTPSKRDLSGVGADRSGLGSPQVAALFDRRASIGESATEFVPGKRTVAFEDPKSIELEIDKERQDEMNKENERKILEREADGLPENSDGSKHLREMIDKLSPKKNPLRGRKSLHVGSAKGLLGKRPAELDDNDENDGVKRIKDYQGSPVKNVLLPQPSSRAETTGRLTRSARRSLDQTSSNVQTPSPMSPTKEKVTTPRKQDRFKDVESDRTVHEVDFGDSHVKNDSELEREVAEEKIHLQDFLNLTSIRFMELTTAKRRPTIAPTQASNGTGPDAQDELSLERCVVAGACTVPMLELYQHSCRELKKYISEGRHMVKEIENDTLEENPPLFREYMSATPSVRALMDSQFKNVKTHSRLLSKAMWYEWRMKLQEGLKEGLVSIFKGMERDDELLQTQEQILSSQLPCLETSCEALMKECNSLQEAARELAESDPVELESAREQLTFLDADIAHKKELIGQLQRELDESTTEVDKLLAQKEQVMTEINDAEKIREECRGWSSKEVDALKARVDDVETKYGWSIKEIVGTRLSMTYRNEIEFVYFLNTLQALQHEAKASQIDLCHTDDDDTNDAEAKRMEKECFLHMIRDYIGAMDDRVAILTNVLSIVSAGWDKAGWALSQLERINHRFPTSVTKTSDSSLAATVSLLLAPLKTRVEVTLRLNSRNASVGMEVTVAVEARVVYGEQFNAAKMAEFLTSRIGTQVGAQTEDWVEALNTLHARLISRGQKH
ncbi:hypothetical protein CDD81_6107 [Ophiocordyceps australis]|uniref:Spc7 kinetochore protein domain-containing protein n=1 Tax=Ophiocordyceps australis TaxID=1399860 RepID=A0A2C5Y6S1_9HYPO|nr:hypothetical protein CDD81_6107 [Ophiocordyceps australis]